MPTDTHATPGEPAADLSIRIGKSVTLDARITSRGLLSVGALVSGILLSTAVIVVAAKRKSVEREAARLAPPNGG